MAEIKFSDEAKEALEQFLAPFPSVSRETNRLKVMRGVEYQLLKKGVGEATMDIFLEAIGETFPKSFEPLTLRFKDPESLTALVANQKKVNEENPLVRVRRWDPPGISLDQPVKKVLGLLAGPRKGGNTDGIMDALLEGARESGADVEKLCFTDISIGPCVGCMACEAKELETYCAVKDDMTDIYRKFLEYDAFVIGFPVYTARECSQAAIFFDRLKALRTQWHFRKLSRLRKGALVVTWGWPDGDSYNHVVENAAFILKLYGVETAQVVTGSGFWYAYYRKGSAKMDEKGLAQAKEAGRALVTE